LSSYRLLALLSATSGAALPEPASGQKTSPTAEELVQATRDAYGPPPPADERCEADQEAASISGEIVVCRRRSPQETQQLRERAETRSRYAEATMDRNNPKTPDFISDSQDQGWPPGCVRVGRVPPPAYMIDFDSLPETPPGSDADRIARGLPPLGRDNVPAGPEAPINPSGSASPADVP
jgi:hypothetical protein